MYTKEMREENKRTNDLIGKQVDWTAAMRIDLAAGKISLEAITNHEYWSEIGETDQRELVTLARAVESKNQKLIEIILDHRGLYNWGNANLALQVWIESKSTIAHQLYNLILRDSSNIFDEWQIRTGRKIPKNEDLNRIKQNRYDLNRLMKELDTETEKLELEGDESTDPLTDLKASLDGLEMAKFTELLKEAAAAGKITSEFAEKFVTWSNS
jgi:hypothetical protein